METITHSPTDGVYPAGDDYAHAVEVREPTRFLLVAGTMGLDPRVYRALRGRLTGHAR